MTSLRHWQSELKAKRLLIERSHFHEVRSIVSSVRNPTNSPRKLRLAPSHTRGRACLQAALRLGKCLNRPPIR